MSVAWSGSCFLEKNPVSPHITRKLRSLIRIRYTYDALRMFSTHEVGNLDPEKTGLFPLVEPLQTDNHRSNPRRHARVTCLFPIQVFPKAPELTSANLTDKEHGPAANNSLAGVRLPFVSERHRNRSPANHHQATDKTAQPVDFFAWVVSPSVICEASNNKNRPVRKWRSSY